jgi:hypothetical protein
MAYMMIDWEREAGRNSFEIVSIGEFRCQQISSDET